MRIFGRKKKSITITDSSVVSNLSDELGEISNDYVAPNIGDIEEEEDKTYSSSSSPGASPRASPEVVRGARGAGASPLPSALDLLGADEETGEVDVVASASTAAAAAAAEGNDPSADPSPDISTKASVDTSNPNAKADTADIAASKDDDEESLTNEVAEAAAAVATLTLEKTASIVGDTANLVERSMENGADFLIEKVPSMKEELLVRGSSLLDRVPSFKPTSHVSPLSGTDEENGYVTMGGGGGGGGQQQQQMKAVVFEEKDVFNGVKGKLQAPKYKDIKWALLFILHFGIAGYFFVDSFLPQYSYSGYGNNNYNNNNNNYNNNYNKNYNNNYNKNYNYNNNDDGSDDDDGNSYNKYNKYNKYNNNNNYNRYNYNTTNHLGQATFVFATGLAGLALAFVAFGYMLRHGETILKTTIVFTTTMCLGVAVVGLFIGERFMCIAGLVGFGVASMYMNMMWRRIPFTAINLSVAISAIRDNMGLFLGASLVSLVGFVWMGVLVTAGINAYTRYGFWKTVPFALFSYYWTHQVLTNVLAVATAGIIGRWSVIGEKSPTFGRGVKEALTRARTYSFGSICYGSLFFGIYQSIQGMSDFLWSKRIPCLPNLLDRILRKINYVVHELNEWAYVYVGLYGYSYTSAAKNTTELFRNKGWDDIVDNYLATNIMFMASMAVGLLTATCGLAFGAFEYKIMWSSGFTNPTTDGFLVGFLVGFLMSSILLSVVTATVNTLVICLAEQPVRFKVNHPELSNKLEGAWSQMMEDAHSDMS